MTSIWPQSISYIECNLSLTVRTFARALGAHGTGVTISTSETTSQCNILVMIVAIFSIIKKKNENKSIIFEVTSFIIKKDKRQEPYEWPIV